MSLPANQVSTNSFPTGPQRTLFWTYSYVYHILTHFKNVSLHLFFFLDSNIHERDIWNQFVSRSTILSILL